MPMVPAAFNAQTVSNKKSEKVYTIKTVQTWVALYWVTDELEFGKSVEYDSQQSKNANGKLKDRNSEKVTDFFSIFFTGQNSGLFD